MKTRFTWLGIIAIVILGISTFFVGCKEDVNAVVRYMGKVVHAGTTNPFADLEVKVTNGEKIHYVSHTDEKGAFVLNVKVNEIDDNYYVLVGDSSCITKRIQLFGWGKAEVDLGTIEIEGPALPVVTTKPVSNVLDDKANSGGNVVSDGRSSVTARGVCWSKAEYPTIEDEHTVNGKGLGEFSSQLTELERGTNYYVRAYATNKQGTAYGEQLTFNTATGLPQVTTDEVTNITATTAICGGEVEANSGYPITARGVCWSDKTATPTTNNDHTEEVAATGHFNSLMVCLEPNKTYYVRAYASNEKGTGYGEMVMFTTESGLPVVETHPVSEIKVTSAICNGTVTSNGGFNIIARGFCYSNSSSIPSLEDNHIEEIADLGKFAGTITNLIPDSKYYVRAYASNEMGTAYGERLSFTTKSGLAQVKTNVVKSCTETTAIIESESFQNEEFNVIERGICWDLKPNPTVASSRTSDGAGIGVYESTITGINIENTSNTYYIRAYATNQNGTAYGNEIVLNYKNLEYEKLPRIEYDGYVYVLFHDIGQMYYEEAIKACEELNFAGYTDWMLPPNYYALVYIMGIHFEGWKDWNGENFNVITEENAVKEKTDIKSSGVYWTHYFDYDGEWKNWKYQLPYYGITSCTGGYCHDIRLGIGSPDATGYRGRVRPVRRYKIY